jgi:putative transcriptional regulator
VSDGVGLDVLRPGRLLVANPLLPDPNFDRTVVLLLAYGDEGALGLVLNRPSDTVIAAPLPRWEHLAAAPAVVFVGGPVQHEAVVICLARAFGHPAADIPPAGWSAVLSDVGTLDLDLDPEGLQASFSQVRVFAGYAGWGAGQLEAEITAGAWWILDAQPEDPFCDQPEGLWKRVLRRQRGPLALVAAYPDDPMLN